MPDVRFLITLSVLAVFAIITFALAAATLGTLNKQYKNLKNIVGGSTATTGPPLNSALAESVRIGDVMTHLNELQRIANSLNGTRAVGTTGFNQTLDYIENYLRINTDFRVNKTFFPVRQFELAATPIFRSWIYGVMQNYTYSTNLSTAHFYHVQYSTSVNLTNASIVNIPNLGCSDSDWNRTNLSLQVALVKRGNCTYRDKGFLAAKYNVSAILIYNDGASSDSIAPIAFALGQNNTLPALSLSNTVGVALSNALQNSSTAVRVQIEISVKNLTATPVGNICADTPSGNSTQTIVIGSHSDSVPAGPGINDNGSGSAANLGLAVALARLFRTSTYSKYKYRVRFCWWGAEEVGLLGSDFHVKQAQNSSVVGERLTDYLINLNYDMLGSPNYIFGIYDGKTARNDTPLKALAGSNKITALFKDWFIQQNLPWDYTDFSGRSDYGPFLAAGIVAGGLFSGADDTKTQAERDRYDQILGQGLGGVPNVVHDPCYHKPCDSIQNINLFAYEKMVQAAAYALEFLGQQNNLKTWLYPPDEIQRFTARSQKQPRTSRIYNSINEYFDLPYF